MKVSTSLLQRTADDKANKCCKSLFLSPPRIPYTKHARCRILLHTAAASFQPNCMMTLYANEQTFASCQQSMRRGMR